MVLPTLRWGLSLQSAMVQGERYFSVKGIKVPTAHAHACTFVCVLLHVVRPTDHPCAGTAGPLAALAMQVGGVQWMLHVHWQSVS